MVVRKLIFLSFHAQASCGFGTLKHSPIFTTLAEVGKPVSAGKKPTRKVVSKKCSEQIKTIVANGRIVSSWSMGELCHLE